MRMCHFRTQNSPICPEQKVFGTNHYYYFHLPISPFHWVKFLKNSYSESRVMRMHHFWAQNGSFAPNKFFWKKSISFSSTYWPLLLCKIFKKVLTADPELWRCVSFGPKIAHLPKWEFFSENLLISLVPFIQAYLRAKNQSQIFIY